MKDKITSAEIIPECCERMHKRGTAMKSIRQELQIFSLLLTKSYKQTWKERILSLCLSVCGSTALCWAMAAFSMS
jgi:hypothetical protein